MDEGTLASCNFTAFDEKVARHPAEIAQLLLKNFQKVTAAKMAREHLSQELHLLERVYYSAVDSGRASVRQAMVPSLTSLLTTAHLLDRYILLLTRDCLRLESCLRGPVPAPYWRSWRSSVIELRQRIPNVHDYFLWQVSVHSHDEAEAGEDRAQWRSRNVGLTLRRDAQ